MASIKNIPPNRIVALLTPLVFAPLAGAISVAAADVAPGVNIDEGSLTAIFIAGATIAFGKAAQWTKGWQAFELAGAGATSAPADDELGEDLDLAPEDDVDDDEIFGPELDSDLEAVHLADEADPDFDDDEDLDELDEDHEQMALLSAPEE
jgi:hypothetical protein